jgi:2-C-methyl-D-erythritol 4-phosphate cytidylyltransferase/2-C-methyl-D-erythritol 2,4-cyclodiphosphate synthase
MKMAAVIVAAGSGVRAGGEIPKQYRLLSGAPVIAWSIRALAAAGAEPIAVAIAPGHEDLFRTATRAEPPVLAVAGASTRTGSVRAGLAALAEASPDIVLIHDAARPGLSPPLIARLVEALEEGAGASAPALTLTDALKRVDARLRVEGEAPRTGLMRVQTPQAFRYKVICEAYERLSPNEVFEDDLAVARAAGVEAKLIPGEAKLLKLTYPEDFALAEQIWSAGLIPCVGQGFDAHRFGEGDHVTLCGVKIAHDKGLVGHSDADAGWHALVDAILGALGEGDIGAHFPPSDAQWKGAHSELFLRHAKALVERAGAKLTHVDVTLICEEPRISPHREKMRERTGEVLGLPLERVSVKATTTERLGFLGRGEGLAAQASATVLRRP